MNLLEFFGYCFVVEIGIIIITIVASAIATTLSKRRAQSTYKHLMKIEAKMKNESEEFFEKLFEENPELYNSIVKRMKEATEAKKKSDEIRDSIISNGVPQEEIEKALENAVDQ